MPKFLQIVSSFAPIIASGAAVYVAWKIGQAQIVLGRRQAEAAELQAKLADVRLRHDLYDRCFAVFECARDLIFHAEINRDVKQAAYLEYVRGSLNAPFILNEDLVSYLDELRKKAGRLALLNKAFQSMPVGDDRTAINEQIADLMTWFGEQEAILIEKFKPFLDLSTRSTGWQQDHPWVRMKAATFG